MKKLIAIISGVSLAAFIGGVSLAGEKDEAKKDQEDIEQVDDLKNTLKEQRTQPPALPDLLNENEGDEDWVDEEKDDDG